MTCIFTNSAIINIMPQRKVQRKKPKIYSTSSTQTEDMNYIKQPTVYLEKLTQSLIDRLQSGTSGEYSESIPVVHRSIVRPTERPSTISQIPYSYKVFARPITNNEKANSTIGAEDDSYLEYNLKTIKPGPLCYKKRVLRRNNHTMVMPAMRSEIAEAEKPSQLLAPIIEHPELSITPSPNDLECNIERQEFENAAVQTEPCFIGIDKNLKSVEVQTDKQIVEIPFNQGEKYSEESLIRISSSATKTIRLQYDDVGAVITSRSNDSSCVNGTEIEETDNMTDEGVKISEADEKMIKIVANTVHIHNHFYKN